MIIIEQSFEERVLFGWPESCRCSLVVIRVEIEKTKENVTRNSESDINAARSKRSSETGLSRVLDLGTGGSTEFLTTCNISL